MTGIARDQGVVRPVAPHEIRTLAHERRAARLARDWATADRLKAEIEAGGWRVVDRGPDFALEPALPPDVEVDGLVLHGAPESVPSHLGETPIPGVTIVALGGTSSTHPAVLVVAGADPVVEGPGDTVVRLAGEPGIGALAHAGLRCVTNDWVVLLPPPAGLGDDVALAPLATTALERLLDAVERARERADASIAGIGTAGATTPDLHAFDPVRDGEADVLLGAPIAARRADLAALLPFDNRIVSVHRFFEWLSLGLRRDTAPEGEPRRVIVATGVPAELSGACAAAASDDHASKRDFYRVLDRFGLDPSLLSVDR